jgi:hypothetical protein
MPKPAAVPGQADSEFRAALRETPRYTYIITAVAALGGILFGYDIGVISGAEKLLKADFHLSSTGEEIAVNGGRRPSDWRRGRSGEVAVLESYRRRSR